VQGHRCTQIVVYVVVPATVTTALAGFDSQASSLALAALDLPLGSASTDSWHVFQLDTGPPPNDLVIVLHRLVI
jgi:hypothetical protein